MKKLILAVILLSGMLAGCTNKEQNEKVPPAPEATAEEPPAPEATAEEHDSMGHAGRVLQKVS